MKAGCLIVFITVQMVCNTECDIISSLIDELKEWTDYYGLTEYPNLWKSYVNEDNPKEKSEYHHLSEKEDDNLEQTEIPLKEDRLIKEVPVEEEHLDEVINHHKNINPLEEVDVTDTKETNNSEEFKVQELSSENMKLNTESNVESVLEKPPTLKSDTIKTKNIKAETKDFGYTPFEYNSAEDNEIIIYNDMVKIELNEGKKSNVQSKFIKNNKDIQVPDKNNNVDYNLLSSKINEEVSIQNVILEENKVNDFDLPLPDTEKNINSIQDNHIPSSSITSEKNVFVEMPIAEDEDVSTTQVPDKNNNVDYYLLSNKINEEVSIQNAILEENKVNDFDHPLPDTEKNIHSIQDNHIQSSSITSEKNVFVEMPIAEDEDVSNTQPAFLKCNNAPNSLSSCFDKKTPNLIEETENTDKSQTDIVKTVEVDKSDFETCSTCKENLLPSYEEVSNQLLGVSQEKKSQYNSDTIEVNREEENENNIVEKHNDQINEHLKTSESIKLSDAKDVK